MSGRPSNQTIKERAQKQAATERRVIELENKLKAKTSAEQPTPQEPIPSATTNPEHVVKIVIEKPPTPPAPTPTLPLEQIEQPATPPATPQVPKETVEPVDPVKHVFECPECMGKLYKKLDGMGLKCKECGLPVAETFDSCPNCGSKHANKKWKKR